MRSNDKRLLITTLLIIITAAAGFAISQDHADAAPSVPAAPIPAVSNAGLAKQPVARAVGVPAIRPRARIAGAAQPQITEADVAQYIATHPMHRNRAALQEHSIIVRIQFLTSQDVSALLGGESTGVPDTTLLCYVELTGNFVFVAPNGALVTLHHGIEVFDAQTGNLLLSGARP